MVKISLVILKSLSLAGCAQNPQQAAAMRQLGMAMMNNDPAPYAPAMYQPNNIRCSQVGNIVNCSQW